MLPSGTKTRKILLVLALLVFAAYLNSLNNAFVSDDIFAIRDSRNIDQASYFWQPPSFYIRNFFIFVIHKFAGLNPLFYRLFNILLHLGSVWTAYFLLCSISGARLAFFSACLFAVHPLLSESVAWISGGPYVQYGFFLLLSFFFYIKPGNNIRFYSVSVFFFLLSLLSSEKAMAFPIILIFWEVSFGSLRRSWKKILPFFLVFCFWVYLFTGKIGERLASLQVEPALNNEGWYNPLLQVPVAITTYLQLIFWPEGLTLYHSEMNFFRVEYILRLALFVLFIGLIVYCYRRSRPIFFWLSFFLISLSPTLTPFKVSWVVAERYAYPGTLGIIVVLALALKKIGENRKLKVASYLVFSFLIIWFCAITILRNIEWKNEDNLWFATARTSPSSPNTHLNLADVYARHRDFKNAIAELEKAIEIKPGYADAYHNLANVYIELGDIDAAAESYQKAIIFNPSLWQSYQNLGAIYFKQGKFELAEKNLSMAIKVNPLDSNLHFNLAVVYLGAGRRLEAAEELKKAREVNSEDQRVKNLLDSLLN